MSFKNFGTFQAFIKLNFSLSIDFANYDCLLLAYVVFIEQTDLW